MKRGLIKWLILVSLFGAILVSPFTNRNKVNIQTQTPTTVQQTVDYKEVIVEDLKQINKLEILFVAPSLVFVFGYLLYFY